MPQPSVKVWYRVEELEVHDGWTQAIAFPTTCSIMSQEYYVKEGTPYVRVLVKYITRSA